MRVGLVCLLACSDADTLLSAQRAHTRDNAVQHHTVYVDAGFDSDNDGAPDRIAVDIARPDGGVVPVLMTASPYYSAARGFADWYATELVPDGYAVVEMEMQGTGRSSGCPTAGGDFDTRSVIAVIDWLNGRARASHEDGSDATATWSTGAVAMIGVSYNATLPIAAAAARVAGLKTIIPIAGITSWYDYARDHGIAYAGWDNHYMRQLANDVSNPRAKERCDFAFDESDDVNAFWSARTYALDQIEASVFAVQGLADENVKPVHFQRLWDAVTAPKQAWLHEGAHVDPVSLRPDAWKQALRAWLAHWLKGEALVSSPVTLEHDGQWSEAPRWPEGEARTYYLGNANTLQTQSPHAQAMHSLRDKPDADEATLIAAPDALKPYREMYTLDLDAPLRVSGTPSVHVRVKADTASAPVTALLVDYSQDPPRVVSRGAIDLKNRASLTAPAPLVPGEAYDVTWALQPCDHVFSGVLGLVLVANDSAYVALDPAARTLEISLVESWLSLPVVE